MPLMIATVKNHLPTSRSPFVVRSNRSEVVEFGRLVEILAASRTTVSRAETVAVMQLYKEELRKQLAEGRTVKTPTGSLYERRRKRGFARRALSSAGRGEQP